MKKKNWAVLIVVGLIGTFIKTIESEITSTIVPTIAPINSQIIPQNNQSEIWQVKPNSIYDGDTLRVINGSEELKIRFCGIDAPEKDQPIGIESRDHLRSLIDQGDGTVYLIPIETDRYDRTIAELFVPLADGSEIHLNSQMVMDGYAYHYEQYSDNCPNRGAIVEAERMARQASVGVWAEPGSEKPWEWRQRN